MVQRTAVVLLAAISITHFAVGHPVETKSHSDFHNDPQNDVNSGLNVGRKP